MFQIIEVTGCYKRVLPPYKYRTNWRPDSNTLSSMDVKKFMTCKGSCMECETPNRSGVRLFCSKLLRLRNPPPGMRFGAENSTIPTRRIHFEYKQA